MLILNIVSFATAEVLFFILYNILYTLFNIEINGDHEDMKTTILAEEDWHMPLKSY